MSLRTRYEDMPSQEIIRRSAELLVHASTSLYTPPPCYDFVFTPIFTAIFTNIGLSAGAISFATSAATFIATTALTIGLQLAMAQKPPKPEAAKVPLAQPIPYRIYGAGRVRTAGAFMLYESSGHHLHAVQAQFGHRIKSFNRYWLHDDEVTLSGGVVVSPGGGRYGDNVTIETRLGLPTETPYAAAVAAFSGVGLWTNDHRGDGQASTYMVAGATRQKDQPKVFPYGHPQLSVEADAALCWDFRDLAQDPDDPDTWQWTQNSAVIIAWHLCFNEFGFGLDYRKALLPVLDMWKEEADICDEDVPLAGGGTEKRYECNGLDTTENGPKSGLNAMLATCDGHLVSRGDGARILTVGKFRESRCATITDRDIVGHQIQYDVLFEDECNRFVPKFTYPATDYSTSDTDYFEDTDAQLQAGRPLVQEGEYSWCHQWRQARRLGIRDWRRILQKVRGSLDIRLSGINSVYARWVRLETPNRLPHLNGKLIENRRSILALTKGAFTMDMIQHPENIDDWNPAVDEGAQPPVPPAPNASGIPTPVINLVQAKPKNGSVYIRVVVIDPENASLTPVVQYRVADIGAGVSGAWVPQEFPDAIPSGGYINLNTNTVPVDQLLEVQVAFKTAGGAYSDWSPTEDVVSTADPVAPIALAGFAVTDAAPHLGRAAFSMTTGNDAHVKTVQLYRVVAGAAFDPNTAIAVGTPIGVAPSTSYAYTHGDATRTNLFANPGFDSDTAWTKGAGWTISSGQATKTAGSASAVTQAIAFSSGEKARIAFTVQGYSAGIVLPRLSGGSPVNDGANRSANGTYLDTVTATVAQTTAGFIGTSAFAGSIDNVVMFKETASCAPQGVWDYYAVPRNGSDLPGPVSGPLTVTII